MMVFKVRLTVKYSFFLSFQGLGDGLGLKRHASPFLATSGSCVTLS